MYNLDMQTINVIVASFVKSIFISIILLIITDNGDSEFISALDGSFGPAFDYFIIYILLFTIIISFLSTTKDPKFDKLKKLLSFLIK